MLTLPTRPMHMHGQSQQTHTRGGCRKTTLRQGWRRRLLLPYNCFPEHLTTDLTMLRSPFGSGLVVCQSRSASGWCVPCLQYPIGDGWRTYGLAVAEPYAALTAIQHGRALLPHNSVRGLQYYTAGATRTQIHTLLQTLVLCITAVRPSIAIYIHGRLRNLDYTAATLATSRT